MSFTTNESTSLTNQLNGYNEAGSNSNNYKGSTSSSSKTTKEATTKKTTKAQEDTSYYFKGSGESHPITSTTPSIQSSPVPDYHQDINNVNLFDYLFWPVLIFVVILMALYGMLKSYARKHPAHGGFAHKHRRMHPGVPEPRIFK